MKNIEIVSKVVSREGEAKHSPSKDISSANLSDYLLKSIWDKVWEIRTDSQGTEYIFGKLPVVTQYGITMYSGDGVDVPSLASGLPFDGRTIWYNPDTRQIEVIGGTGGGSGEGVSNFWDLSGIPSWITNSKPKYTYSEIEGTPDLTKYALASQIPSLSGYATESWVTKQNYATKATTLGGYGITDAYTKTNVDDLLKSYVTLGGTQTITGEKNFTGGLKVNGSPIYYDTEKKYWKLEGDLLVTGGVTMYGSDSSFTPSTIMDAIAVDGTTISKSGGVLKVIGGTGGGVADSVAWANITGKPTWIGSSKPTYSYSEITGAISTTELQNYLTSNSYLNVTSGDNRYLQLSGGTLTDGLTISAGNLIVSGSDTVTNSLYPTKDKQYTLGNSSRYWSDIYTKSINGGTPWTSANDGSGSGLDADTLDGYHVTNFMSYVKSSGYVQANLLNSELWSMAGGDGYIEYYDNGTWFNSRWGKVMAHYGFEGSLSGNATSATKLQTARTIWGQSFDGTGNVSGVISGVDGISFKSSNAIDIDYNSNFVFKYTHLQDWSIQQQNTTKIFMVRNDGNVGIGTASPAYKLHVEGTMYGDLKMKTARTIWGKSFDGTGNIDGDFTQTKGGSYGGPYGGQNFYIYNKVTSDISERYGSLRWAFDDYATFRRLDIISKDFDITNTIISFFHNGDVLVNGGITMYSDQRKKTILNHVELSLKQIAEAPLIEHYYNSDESKTTHVGSIAQYWASINDWFCKLDSEGFYTMEIQNAALASAISIARALARYETKTDKTIKQLKKRICQLEEEVERFKSA